MRTPAHSEGRSLSCPPPNSGKRARSHGPTARRNIPLKKSRAARRGAPNPHRRPSPLTHTADVLLAPTLMTFFSSPTSRTRPRRRRRSRPRTGGRRSRPKLPPRPPPSSRGPAAQQPHRRRWTRWSARRRRRLRRRKARYRAPRSRRLLLRRRRRGRFGGGRVCCSTPVGGWRWPGPTWSRRRGRLQRGLPFRYD